MEKRRLLDILETHLKEEAEEARSRAVPDAEREELESLVLMYRFLPRRDFSESDGELVAPGALVELSLGAARAFYFVAPRGGGLVTQVDGEPVQVVTPQSPLGEAMLGKKVDETVRVEVRGGVREYRVISIR